MEKVMREVELTIVTENRIGVLAEVADLIAANGMNIENICAYKIGEKASLHFLTNNPEKVKKVLEEKGYQVKERDVIVLSLWNRPGALSEVASKFKQKGINLQSVYGTCSPGGERTAVIFSSEDNDKASEVFLSMVTEDI
jgi:hypothetical protein